MRALFYVSTILLLCQITETFGSPLNVIPSDVLESAWNITSGVFEQIPDLIPSPSDIFNGAIDLIAGYPFAAVSSVVNSICSAAMSEGAIQPAITPDIEKMSLILLTPGANYTFGLLDTDELWNSPAFDKNKSTVFLVTGWQTNYNETNEAIETLSKAYFCRGDVNIVALNTAQYVDTLYTWSALNTEKIGENLALSLFQLANYVDPKTIHLIGHSLGAHIVGAAGRNFNYMSEKEIGRITGLDPARPCFNHGEVLTGLHRGDALFVDVIHTNPGILGKRDPIGDADFYPDGLGPIQKGCILFPCAHERAWRYYAESVYPGNEKNFLAKRCTSAANLENDKCRGQFVPMGYAASSKLRGNFFLGINSKSPFGQNASTDILIAKCNS